MLLFFFFIIDLSFLISAMISQIFILTAELVIPGTQTNEANAEIGTQPVTAETKIIKSSTLFQCLYFFLYISLINSE